MPKDYRKLLKTPKFVQITAAAGGQMWYNSIEKNLQSILSKLDKDLSIELNFNVDGLPIFKSSQRCFWPILSNIHRDKKNFFMYLSNFLTNSVFVPPDMPNVQPMIVGIWCGEGKPNNLDEFLSQFVAELNVILQNGITVNGHNVKIGKRCFICDAPARAFIKGIVISLSFFVLKTSIFLRHCEF